MDAVETNKNLINYDGKNPISVLLIGNNPIELSWLYERLKNFKGMRFLADTSFDLKDSMFKVTNNKPNCILIDDNMDNGEIKRLIDHVNNDEQTRDISIAVLKNSNYRALTVSGIQDFILKTEASAERLTRLILNAIHLKRTRSYLFRTYRKNRGKFAKLFKLKKQ